jgi:NAD(P)-dependent dehydrogenase (short-subunit alcohol dehydrogenase family)
MDIDRPDNSRRNFVGGAAAGLIAASTASVNAQQHATPPKAESGTPPRNPVETYPKPPFAKQSQPWPGLQGKMDPVPDCGEKSYRGSGRLAGKKALITGGDSGIGRAAAIAFAREGADVAINYLPPEEADAQDVAKVIRAEGRKAVTIAGDLKEEAFCKRLVDTAARELGGLDIVVNNAARQIARKSIDEITSAQFDEVLKTNLYAMFWITKAALAHLKSGSAIVNTTSVVAYDPPEEIIDYACTKAAILNFTKGLAKQLAPKGIRVNGVAPGPFWTALQVTGGQLPEKLPEFGKDSPMKRPGQPAEIAALYVLAASEEATYSTGQIFGAVGGRGGP